VVDSQAKGKRAERDVCAYLTRQGLPARRHVRTGTRDVHDEGDIRLDDAPVTIEVKSWGTSQTMTVGAARTLVEKLDRQRRPDDLGWLVQKANGHADPGVWWCWMSQSDATRLLAGDSQVGSPLGSDTEAGSWPIRMLFSTAVALLHAGDWVRPPRNPFL
jgi:hypothetical protein